MKSEKKKESSLPEENNNTVVLALGEFTVKLLHHLSVNEIM